MGGQEGEPEKKPGECSTEGRQSGHEAEGQTDHGLTVKRRLTPTSRHVGFLEVPPGRGAVTKAMSCPEDVPPEGKTFPRRLTTIVDAPGALLRDLHPGF